MVSPKRNVGAAKASLRTEIAANGKARAASTINDGYLGSLRTVLRWAASNQRVSSNPALGVSARAPKKARLRERSLTDAEAKLILKAALQTPQGKLSVEGTRARRRVPLICAYNGPRVNEITRLRAEDIHKDGGIWVLRITPEARERIAGHAPSTEGQTYDGWTPAALLPELEKLPRYKLVE